MDRKQKSQGCQLDHVIVSHFVHLSLSNHQFKLATSALDLCPLQRVAANNHRRTSTTSSRKPSLALCDTPDGLRELGHLELMSRELDPSGTAQLHCSVSTDSLSSISSIANNFGHDFTVGQLEVTLAFEPPAYPGQGAAGTLHLSLHQGKDLLEREEGDFPGCFIRVSLGPEELNVGVTRVRRFSTLLISKRKH